MAVVRVPLIVLLLYCVALNGFWSKATETNGQDIPKVKADEGKGQNEGAGKTPIFHIEHSGNGTFNFIVIHIHEGKEKESSGYDIRPSEILSGLYTVFKDAWSHFGHAFKTASTTKPTHFEEMSSHANWSLSSCSVDLDICLGTTNMTMSTVDLEKREQGWWNEDKCEATQDNN